MLRLHTWIFLPTPSCCPLQLHVAGFQLRARATSERVIGWRLRRVVQWASPSAAASSLLVLDEVEDVSQGEGLTALTACQKIAASSYVIRRAG